MGFSRQEYWSSLPFPSPRDLPNPGIEPISPALQAEAFTVWTTRETFIIKYQFSSVQLLSHVRLFATPWIAACQASLSISNSRSWLKNSHPLSRWCHPAVSSSVVPFSSCSQSLPASESFPVSQLFAWGGQSTGVSALQSFLPKKSQGWSPLGWTGWISLQSKGLSSTQRNEEH